MSAEAIKILEGRPTVIKLPGGWVVQLTVHDVFYLDQLRSFKRRLRAAHPDAGGNASTFRAIVTERNRWLAKECDWYADLCLLPPDGNTRSKERLERNLRLRNQKERPRMKYRCSLCRRTRMCTRQENGQMWCEECTEGETVEGPGGC